MKVAVVIDGRVQSVKKGRYAASDLEDHEVQLPDDANIRTYLGKLYDADTDTFSEDDVYTTQQNALKATPTPPAQPEASKTAYRRAFMDALKAEPRDSSNWFDYIYGEVSKLPVSDNRRMIWENVTQFDRSHEDMVLFTNFGMTEETLNSVFMRAMKLEA